MLLEVLLSGLGHLDGRQLEALVLETGDDGADKASLNPVRFDSLAFVSRRYRSRDGIGRGQEVV